MQINTQTGLISWTPDNDAVGLHPVTVQVSDSGGLSDQQQFSLTVNNSNDQPKITSSPITQVDKDSDYQYQLQVEDIDINEQFSYSLVTSPLGMQINAQTGLISWTPDNDAVGLHTITVQVSDNGGLSDQQQFSLTVNNSNDQPKITSSPVITIAEDTVYQYTVQAEDVDLNDSLSYQLSVSPAGMTIDAETGLINWTPDNDAVGIHPVTLMVTDTAGLTDTQSYQLTVSNSNDAPLIDSSPVLSIEQDSAYIYQVQASDIDVDDSLSYSLTVAPADMLIDANSGSISWTPDNDAVGSHPISVTVTDQAGLNVDQNYILTVFNRNDDPAITSTPITTVDADSEYRYQVEAEDIDVDDTLTFSLLSSISSLTIDPDTGLISGTPDLNDIGTHPIMVLVTDSSGAVDQQSFDLQVLRVNALPVISSTPPGSTTADQPFNYQIEVTDQENDALTFELINAPDGMSITPQTGLINWIPQTEQIGTFTFIVRITDAYGNQVEQSITLVVEPAPVAKPIFESEPVLIGFIDQQYQYAVLAVDPDNLALSYALTENPAGMQIDPQTGLISWIPGQIGSFNIQIEVSNGQVVALQSFELAIIDPEPSHAGDDFWIIFGQNQTRGPRHRLYITGEQATTGLVELPQLGLSYPFTVIPGEVTTVEIEMENKNAIRVRSTDNGVHITAGQAISVYGLNSTLYSSDGFLALPTRALGREYLLLDYQDGLSEALFLASEDDTQISLTLREDTYLYKDQTYPAGHTFNITLNKGESYSFWMNDNYYYPNQGTSGLVITGNRPFAAFSNVICANIPRGYNHCDHQTEQLTATQYWGMEFASVPLASRARGDTFRMVAAYDDTNIRINGDIVAQLNRGEWMEDIIEERALISSNHPIQVAQFSNSQSFDAHLIGNFDHDPFTMLLPAKSQYLSSYTLSTPDSGFVNHYINIIIPTSGLATLLLDGVAVDDLLFEAIPESNLLGAALPISVGTHQLSSEIPFSAAIYGFNAYESYGYPGVCYYPTLMLTPRYKSRHRLPRPLWVNRSVYRPASTTILYL